MYGWESWTHKTKFFIEGDDLIVNDLTDFESPFRTIVQTHLKSENGIFI